MMEQEQKACAFNFGENVVAVHFESSFSKQDSKQKQSSGLEVKKAIATDRNQLSMCSSGREEIVQYRREVSRSSLPNLLRLSDHRRGLVLEYPEMYTLLFGKQNVSRK